MRSPIVFLDILIKLYRTKNYLVKFATAVHYKSVRINELFHPFLVTDNSLALEYRPLGQ